MNDKETLVFKQTKLRNLKRQYAKLVQHASLVEETASVKAEIDSLEKELV